MKRDPRQLLVFIMMVAGLFMVARAFDRNVKEAGLVEERPPIELTSKLDTIYTATGVKISVLTYKDKQGEEQKVNLSEAQTSFALMAQAFIKFTGDSSGNKEDFVAYLESLGLKPIVAEDRQKLIEDMTVIRTENSLPGTRYIHAQWDGKIGKHEELQHLSFEIPKGEHALEDAKRLMAQVMPLGEADTRTEPDLVLYRVDGYVIWARRLTWQFMNGHSFNAYAPEDEGNIRIAIERDIHPQGDTAHSD